jgi:mannose-6-phosphate isomerase-like protein (cupin superfamily)
MMSLSGERLEARTKGQPASACRPCCPSRQVYWKHPFGSLRFRLIVHARRKQKMKHSLALLAIGIAILPGWANAQGARDFIKSKVQTVVRAPLSLAPGSEVAGELTDLPAGTVVPLHTENVDELYFIVSGEWQMETGGGDPRILRSGQAHLVAKGTPQGGRVVGPDSVRLLTIEISDGSPKKIEWMPQ